MCYDLWIGDKNTSALFLFRFPSQRLGMKKDVNQHVRTRLRSARHLICQAAASYDAEEHG